MERSFEDFELAKTLLAANEGWPESESSAGVNEAPNAADAQEITGPVDETAADAQRETKKQRAARLRIITKRCDKHSLLLIKDALQRPANKHILDEFIQIFSEHTTAALAQMDKDAFRVAQTLREGGVMRARFYDHGREGLFDDLWKAVDEIKDRQKYNDHGQYEIKR